MNDFLGLGKREIERIERQAYIEQEYINDVWNYDNEFRMNTYSCDNKIKGREGNFDWYNYCEMEEKEIMECGN